MSKPLSQNQKTFNKVVNFLLKQNKKSIDPSELCMYRGPEGTKCAAGCLIPDQLYDKSLEGIPVGNFNKVGELIKSQGHNVTFVRELQLIHDEYDVVKWPVQFKELARICGLKLPSELQKLYPSV